MQKKISVVLCLLVLIIAGVSLVEWRVHTRLDLIKVPFANQNIAPRTKIEASMITWKEVPSSFIDSNTALLEEEIIGKYTEIEMSIPQGSFYYLHTLWESSDLPDFPELKLREQQVAFTLPVDVVKTSGNTLMEGQYIDVYASFFDRNQVPVVDKIVAQVRILAIRDAKGKGVADVGYSGSPKIMILAVHESIVNQLKIIDTLGSLDVYPSNSIQSDEQESQILWDSKVWEKLASYGQ
ncbi:MAG: RcpC/CpaB family pilus assembly protein [Erysipelotrichaceae bacterium]